MTSLNLGTALPGTRVQDEFLVLDREERTQASGDPFVILTLGNSTGRLPTAPIWAAQLSWVDGIDPGVIVQVVGQVAVYARTNRRQLQLTAPVRRVSSELVRWNAFLPRIDVDAVKLWDRLDRMRAEMESPALRAVVDLFFADDAFRVDFERAPASVDGHHAKIGGLLLHVWEVATIARQIARTVQAHVDVAVAGAFLHDVGMLDAIIATPTGFEQTERGRVLGPAVLGTLMLEGRLNGDGAVPLSESQRLELHYLMRTTDAAGSSGAPPPLTIEADILRRADEASIRANEMADAIADNELFDARAAIAGRPGDRLRSAVWRRPHSW